MTNIPAAVLEVFEPLRSEVVWLHARWQVFRQLFAVSEVRVALLNECAPGAFLCIQDAMLGDVQIGLCKLTDPPRTGNRYDNLTIPQLQGRVDQLGLPALASQLQALLDQLMTECDPFREHRNKRLAHLDLATAMQTGVRALPPVSRAMIEQALGTVRAYMNAIEGYFDDTEMAYERFLSRGDGEALVHTLKAGLRYEEMLQAGKVSWADWQEGAWKDA